jgi:hypothetical protein
LDPGIFYYNSLVTAAKYKFIGYKKDFLEIIDENNLLTEYGGKLKFSFDFKSFKKSFEEKNEVKEEKEEKNE